MLRFLALLVLLALHPAPEAIGARRPRPEPCPDGRFPLYDTAPVGTARETIVLRNGKVALEPTCPPVTARIHSTRRGTRVQASWTGCGGSRRVRLDARIDAATCSTVRGVVRSSKKPRNRIVKTTRSPYDVPLDPRSPWPKFRRNPEQTGLAPAAPRVGSGRPWSFQTGKGIFSTPVIDGDGNVYVGSADRTFYALAPDGTVRWKLLTGEIIDSAALLDDRGRVYVGSGDGKLYARDAATGEPVWTFTADPPAVNNAFINWFEGNVAMGGDGTLYVPNDNFFTYAIDRDTAQVRWTYKTLDQTWSLPAFDTATGRLFIGNNFQLLDNVIALDAATGELAWKASTSGTVAASPMLATNGTVLVGGFDGFVHCYDRATGVPCWTFGARDHIYASPAALPDGTIVQPSADGTVYGLDPATGALRWQFDTRDAIRSSPAVDGDGNIYVGSGEGRLFVLNPDGTLRWSMLLIDGPRDDLNASPALGPDAVLIAGESGEVFSIPYDWCLRPEGAADARCHVGGEDSWTTARSCPG